MSVSGLIVRVVLAASGIAVALGVASAQVAPPPDVPAAAAPAQIDPFQGRVDRAAQLMETDQQAALEELDHMAVESVELRKTRPLTAAERPAHRQLFVLRARAHLQLMNNTQVEESARELLRVDPFFSETLSPREQEVVDDVRSRESGLLEVSSPVRDCTILVDEFDIGLTGDVPVRISLVAGTYQLRLEKPGYQGIGARVIIVPRQTLSVTDLAPAAMIPPMAFIADREGVEVLVDNQPSGTTVNLSQLRDTLSAEEWSAIEQAVSVARFDMATSAGFLLRSPPVDRSVSVRFRADCLIEEARTVAITAESLAAIEPGTPLLWFGESSAVRMRPDVGTLRVASTPGDADVYIDGQLSGRTPFERSVCAGEHRVRVRHRIGSYNVTATVTRGRTEGVDVTLKPGLGFLGAVETVQGALRPAPDLTTRVDRALASAVQSFRVATLIDVPPQVARWTDRSTAELVSAADRKDHESLTRLLANASENYDAPLLMAAARRGSAPGSGPLDLLIFWIDHAGIDRVRIPELTAAALAEVLQAIEDPPDPAGLVYEHDLGLRLADTRLPEAPVMVVSVEPGSPAALAGVKPGDALVSVDGSLVSASQVAELAARKRPGEILTLRLTDPAGQAKQAALPVQRRPRRAPVFEPHRYGNVMMAKLHAALAVAQPADRDLLTFSLALVHYRFGQYRVALDLLSALSQVPSGDGVGPGSVLYFRARCHEELGERDRAEALLREAVTAADVLTDDGTTAGDLVKLRLGLGGDVPGAVAR